MSLDLKTIMAELHYGAEHFTDEERRFFDGVWQTFKRTNDISRDNAGPVLDLYKRLQYRRLDVNGLVSKLEANALMLSDLEQSQVEGARFTLEYSGGTLDTASIDLMIAIGKALHDRQHNTLTTRSDGIQAVLPAQIQPMRALPGAPIQAEPPRRPSARRNIPLGPIPALEAAYKLLKGGS